MEAVGRAAKAFLGEEVLDANFQGELVSSCSTAVSSTGPLILS